MRSCRSSAARRRETAAPICGSNNGSLSELSRGRRKSSTSSAQRNPFRKSSRAMHSDPQISLHAIAPPFNSSRAAKIQRLCRVKLGDDFSPVDSPSTRLCRVKLPGCSGPIGFPSTRFCRVKLGGDFSPLGSPSTRLCTDQFIRALLPDKIFALARSQ